MLNPMMDMVKELRKMHTALIDRLDVIITRLDNLIENDREFKNGYYGDGR